MTDEKRSKIDRKVRRWVAGRRPAPSSAASSGATSRRHVATRVTVSALATIVATAGLLAATTGVASASQHANSVTVYVADNSAGWTLNNTDDGSSGSYSGDDFSYGDSVTIYACSSTSGTGDQEITVSDGNGTFSVYNGVVTGSGCVTAYSFTANNTHFGDDWVASSGGNSQIAPTASSWTSVFEVDNYSGPSLGNGGSTVTFGQGAGFCLPFSGGNVGGDNWSGSGAPPGMGYDGNNCYSGTPSQAGSWSGSISDTEYDGAGNGYGTTGYWTVTANSSPPYWTSAPGSATVVNGTYYGNIATFSANSGDASGVSYSTSGLPAGLGLSGGTIYGTPSTTAGVDNITVYASNDGGTISAGFTLTVDQVPAFTSAASASFTVGSYGAVGISSSGYPAPTITESGALPPGMAFNGSSLYGTPTGGAGGTWYPTFIATNSAGTTDQSFTLTVNPEATSVGLSAPNGTVDGTTAVTATISPSPDGGTVAFSDTAGYIHGCGAVPVSSGKAVCDTAVLSAAGNDTVYAQYEGDASYATSSEASTTFQVAKASTGVSVSASPANPAVNTTTLLTATVSPTPDGGTVAFSDANGYVSGCTAVPLSSGTATCTTGTITSIATDAVTAIYSGDANFTTSTGNLSLSPVPGTPSVAVSASPAAGTYDQTTTITATISPAPGGGTVAFSDANGYISGCSSVTVSGTSASCVTGLLAAAGTDAITANYSGDTNYNAASGGFTLTINKAVPALSLSVSPSSPTVAGTATIIATVSPAPGGGTVAFSDTAGYISGCSSVAVSGTTATCVTATITSVTPDEITASYSGDANFTTAGASLLVTPAPATTSLALAASPATPSALSTTTVTATVSPVPDGGTVAFTDSKGFITGCAAVAVNSSSGTASCTTGELTSVGTDDVSATYSGDADYGSAENLLPVTVGKAPTSTTVTASPSPVQVTTPTIITATVSPVPDGGTVAFSDTEGAITTLDGCGAVPVDPTTGKATCETSSLPAVGTDDVTAIYSGDTTYATSTDIAAVTVGQVVESLSVATSPSVAVVGAKTTVTATLSPTPGGGTVAFSDTGGLFSGCGAVIVIDGSASCTMTTAPSTTGTDVISVAYSGDTDYAAVSNGPGTTIDIDEVPLFTSSASPGGTVGQALNFSVTASALPAVTSITESGALPSGITFTNGGSSATLSGTPGEGSGGTYPISFTAANGVTAAGTQQATLTIDAPPNLTSSASMAFTIGSASTYPIATTGFPAPSITESGSLPSGITVVDNGDGTGTVSGVASAGTAGSWPITLTASNGVGSPLVQHVTIEVTSATTTTVSTGGSGSGSSGSSGSSGGSGSGGSGSSGSSGGGSSGSSSGSSGSGDTTGDSAGTTGASVVAYTYAATVRGSAASSLSCKVSPKTIHPTMSGGSLADLGLQFSCNDAGHVLKVAGAMTKSTVVETHQQGSKIVRRRVTVWRGTLQLTEGWRHLTYVLTPSAATVTTSLHLSGKATGYGMRNDKRLHGTATLSWSLAPVETS